ncbi:ATP-dependent RNA helicase drs-1 [Striga asiatica]|uniref:ATP-dependent RNA helicase drs-1 n=1 Tax=Striga asiatica TaxID=4170 RepID=A0A5A7Q5F8_STRAF|nr:ATP-dependent RNA helicase drs-1 [Striga asiatica]
MPMTLRECISSRSLSMVIGVVTWTEFCSMVIAPQTQNPLQTSSHLLAHPLAHSSTPPLLLQHRHHARQLAHRHQVHKPRHVHHGNHHERPDAAKARTNVAARRVQTRGTAHVISGKERGGVGAGDGVDYGGGGEEGEEEGEDEVEEVEGEVGGLAEVVEELDFLVRRSAMWFWARKMMERGRIRVRVIWEKILRRLKMSLKLSLQMAVRPMDRISS